jgi:transposase-like protein
MSHHTSTEHAAADARTKSCHWDLRAGQRMLRTHRAECEDAACPGCLPCPERHCQVCRHAHVTVDGHGHDRTCATCLAGSRQALQQLGTLAARMLGEAIVHGVRSHASMLAGPAADVEAWGYRRMSALAGRIDAAWLEDCRDEQHPSWVVGTWDLLARDHLGHERDRPTLSEARGYLDHHLTRLAHDAAFDFAEMATALTDCVRHLEDVLRDGEREQTGAPCPACGRARLVKVFGLAEKDDRWSCPRCAQRWTDHDYRAKVEGTYMHVAPELTASQIRATYRVPETTVRKWAERGKVHKRGRDSRGRALYDVADVIAARDTPDAQDTA